MKKKNEDRSAADLADLITPTEAARVRGVTRAAITALIKRGRLNTIEIGGRSFLRRSEVETFEPEKPGPKVEAA
jgi:excisionase family DNA binding protein